MTVLAPHAYLELRRQAAGLSLADVAARIATEPREPEHLRRERLELIEAGAQPASFSTIVGLRLVFRFDIHVLSVLEAIAQGAAARAPQLCRVCACSDHDPCIDAFGDGCAWVEEDLCSACFTQVSGQGVLA